MTATTRTAPAVSATAPRQPSARRQSLFLTILNWLARKDQAYRQARKLDNMPDERLKDMGLTRRQVNKEFYWR